MKVLFSGIGGPTPLGLARSIKSQWPDYSLIGIDSSVWAPSFYGSGLFDKTIKVPNADDIGYWQAIEDLVKNEQIDFAFIVPETEILIWSKRMLKNILPCEALIPDFKLSKFCYDKLAVANFLFKDNLTPKTLELDIEELNDMKVDIPFPYWVRVKSGAGALGALKINSEKDLSTWISVHSNRNDFIASEYLPGRNYACKLLCFNGEIIKAASAERIDYLLSAAAPSGISGMCSRGRLLNRPDLIELSTEALRRITNHLDVKLHGMFTIDFKENSEGKPLITEINIRHVSFNYAFTLGGVNFAKITLQKHFDKEVKEDLYSKFEEEYFFVRGVDFPIALIKTVVD